MNHADCIALPAWTQLTAALGRSGRIPCTEAKSDDWGADDPKVQAASARACGPCPVLDECREYAMAAGEPVGVWGGLTAAQRRRDGTATDGRSAS